MNDLDPRRGGHVVDGPAVERKSGPKVVDHSGVIFGQSAESLQLAFADRNGIFEDGPHDDLVAAGSGQRAVVPIKSSRILGQQIVQLKELRVALAVLGGDLLQHYQL